MSNVYSVGNNRQLIIYNAGSNIFLRVAHFGGLDRPTVLAADYLCGLTECIYNSSPLLFLHQPEWFILT